MSRSYHSLSSLSPKYKLLITVSILATLVLVGSTREGIKVQHVRSEPSIELASDNIMPKVESLAAPAIAMSNAETVEPHHMGRMAKSRSFAGSAVSNQANPNVPQLEGRMLAKETYLQVRSTNVSISANFVLNTIDRLGGYVERSTKRQDSVNINGRIPEDKFLDFLELMRKPGFNKTITWKLDTETIENRDITAEYVDASSRHITLNATFQQLQSVMKKAVKIKDILDTQRELSRVQMDMEARARQKFTLSKLVAMSKISININRLYKAEPPSPSTKTMWQRWPFVHVVKAISFWIYILELFATWLIYAVVTGLPVIFIGSLVVKMVGSSFLSKFWETSRSVQPPRDPSWHSVRGDEGSA